MKCFCSLECSAPVNWLRLYTLQAWQLVQHSPLCFGSLFISNYFQHFLKRATNRPERAERGQSLYLCNKLGPLPPGASPAKLSTLQTLSRHLGSNAIPGQVTSKPWNVRTAGLHSTCSTSNRIDADRITQYYIPAGWIILAIKTSSSQLNEQ